MKTKKGLLKHTESFILITLWILILIAPVLIFQRDNDVIWPGVFKAWVGILPFFLLFAINHFLLVPYLLFRKNKKSLFLLAVISLLFAFSISTYLTESSFDQNKRPPLNNRQQPPPSNQNLRAPDPFRKKPPPANPIAFPPFLNTIIISILVVGFDTGLRMMTRWTKLEQEKKLARKGKHRKPAGIFEKPGEPPFFYEHPQQYPCAHRY